MSSKFIHPSAPSKIEEYLDKEISISNIDSDSLQLMSVFCKVSSVIGQEIRDILSLK